jgi:hypothetical protein
LDRTTQKNGTCTVVTVDPKGKVFFWTRHKEPHKAWTPTTELKDYFSRFPDSVWVGELLHSKGPSVKNFLYLIDVLGYEGSPLFGTMLTARQERLQGLPACSQVGMVRNYETGFCELFNGLSDPLDEGLVLKNPKAMLQACYREGNNTNWQVKCRRGTKNYTF